MMLMRNILSSMQKIIQVALVLVLGFGGFSSISNAGPPVTGEQDGLLGPKIDGSENPLTAAEVRDDLGVLVQWHESKSQAFKIQRLGAKKEDPKSIEICKKYTDIDNLHQELKEITKRIIIGLLYKPQIELKTESKTQPVIGLPQHGGMTRSKGRQSGKLDGKNDSEKQNRVLLGLREKKLNELHKISDESDREKIVKVIGKHKNLEKFLNTQPTQ